MGSKPSKPKAGPTSSPSSLDPIAHSPKAPLIHCFPKKTLKTLKSPNSKTPTCASSNAPASLPRPLPSSSSSSHLPPSRPPSHLPPSPPPLSHDSSELIPGIPSDDLSTLCLARVPLGSFQKLRSVCRRWRHVADSGELLRTRHLTGTEEAFLCALEWASLGSQEIFAHLWVFQIEGETWHDLGCLPFSNKISPCTRLIAIGSTLIFCGGAYPSDEFDRFIPTGEIWRYDFLTGKATKGAKMLTPRDRFASAVIGNKLYIAGGLRAGFNYAHDSLHSAEIYDLEKDCWKEIADMPWDSERMPALECQGATVNGKFYVRSSWAKGLADVYDPVSGKWSTEEHFFPSNTSPPFYTRLDSRSNRLYLLDAAPSLNVDRTYQLRIYDGKEEVWENVGPLPTTGFMGAVSLAGFESKVFLVGGEDPNAADAHEAWAARLPFNGRIGKLMAGPCMYMQDVAAEERARTIRAMASEHSRPHHFRRPGHVFPLSAKPWGVLQRAGHTEAAVDLAVLAGLPPVGVLCEVVNKDGTMARMPQLSKLAADHNLCLVSIADLIQYRLERESVLEKGVVATHSYNGGQFRSQSYTSMLDSTQHFALSLGAVEGADDVHVFVHRECVTGDVFGMTSCSCQDDLRGAINEIRRVGKGVLVYLRGGEACTHSSERNNTQEEAAAALVGGEQSSHTRAVAISGQIVLDLGIRSVCVQGGSVEAHSLEHYVRTCRHQFAS